MKKLAGTLASVVALGCGASAQSHQQASNPARQSMSAEEARAACERSCSSKLNAPVDVAYRDAVGGASVIFTTRGDPAGLRACVSEAVRARDELNANAKPQYDLNAIPHSSSVQDVEGGAMMTLIASAQNDANALRRNVQQDVWSMQRGCGANELL